MSTAAPHLPAPHRPAPHPHSPHRSAGSRSAPVRPARPAVLVPGLRRLLRGSWEQRRPFAVAVLGAIAFSILQVTTSRVIGTVTQEAIIPSFREGRPLTAAVWLGGAAILGVGMLRAVAVAVRRVSASATQFSLHRLYRERLVALYERVPLLWHRRQATGTLLSSVHADIEATFYPMAPFPFALGTIVMLVYAGVVVALIDPVLLLVMAVLVVLLIALNVLFQRYAAPIAVESQRLRARVAEVAHESFDGANVVKSLGREDAEEQRFTAAAEDLRANGIRFGYVRGWFDPVIDALPNIGILLVALLGAWRIREGELTPGDLVQVAYLFTLMALPIRSFGWVLGDLARTVVGGARVERLMASRERQVYGGADLPDGPGRLALSDVSFVYRDEAGALAAPDGILVDADLDLEDAPGTPALCDVTLTADPAQGARTVAIVGATGSGKSTLAMLAGRLIDPTSGTIRLDGADLRDLSAEALAAGVVLVLQQAFVFDDTVRANVTLGEDFTEDEIRWALRVAQAEAFVDALPAGLDTPLGERGGTLSGGQRQRIALARALVRRPRLLILDDATSACDPSVELAILEGIRREMTGSTLLLVAYRKSTIAIADRVVFLEHGRVAAEGTHARLRETSAAYRALVDAYDEAAISHGLLDADGDDAAGTGAAR
ncbi:ABC transporter ATP-binding protein [Brachybacterium huguangmaarense]